MGIGYELCLLHYEFFRIRTTLATQELNAAKILQTLPHIHVQKVSGKIVWGFLSTFGQLSMLLKLILTIYLDALLS